jgi:hypothetical protein
MDLPQVYSEPERSLAELTEGGARPGDRRGVEAWAKHAKDGVLLGKAVHYRK